MIFSRGAGRFLSTGLVVSSFVLSGFAVAAVPVTTSIEGVLTSAGGGAVSDGAYDVVFSIYDNQTTTQKAWSEGPVKIAVKGGRFSYRLGLTQALDAKALAALKTPWFGIKVSSDPELPRQPLNSVVYAQVANRLACSGCVSNDQLAASSISASKLDFTYAGSATKGGAASDLACTGCVGVKEMKFDGDIDLGGNGFKAKNGTFISGVVATTVTAMSFVGDGSKLSGIKMPMGECKNAGEVVKGINPDGTLKCVKAMDPSGLPTDGLNEISNDLLTNQFINTIATSEKNVVIPDNQGTDAVSNLTFPNIGTAQKFALYVHVENTDLSKIAISVLPPEDKKVGWTLCDPCGAKDAKVFKKTFDLANKPQKGDLASWIGKNPQGLWNLKVTDTGYCIKQAAGNLPYCDPDKKTDGKIFDWNIKIQTLSNKKVQSNGLFYTDGGLQLKAATKAPVACGPTTVGYVYIDTTTNALTVCNGQKWFAMSIDTTFGSASNPALNCKDLLAKQPSTQSGVYWIDPDGKGSLGAFKAYCDMTTNKGGWTLIASTKIPYSGNGGGDTVWKIGMPHPGLQTTKTTTSTVSLVNTIPFSTLSDFRFTCYSDLTASKYGIDWTFSLANAGNKSLLGDIYDNAKMSVYGKGKLTQTTGKTRLIGYDNATSKADWGLGSNGGDAHYWTHESWGQVDSQGGHCQEVGVAHTSSTLNGKGIYHIWVR